MKKTFKNKIFCLLLSLIIVLGLAACENGDVAETGRPSGVTSDQQVSVPEKPNVSEQSKEESDNIIEEDKIPYPLEMYYSSGAGAWYSKITIHADGSFEGEFHDSDMGDIDEGYPNGTVYWCKFSGFFSKPQKVNDYTYSLNLETVTIEDQDKGDYIDEGMLFKLAFPYGLMSADNKSYAKEFMLFTPEAPTSEMREEFLFSWPERFEADPNGKLNLYGLLNTETDEGFFIWDL